MKNILIVFFSFITLTLFSQAKVNTLSKPLLKDTLFLKNNATYMMNRNDSILFSKPIIGIITPVTPVSNILQWSTDKYMPYTSPADNVFSSGWSNPTWSYPLKMLVFGGGFTAQSLRADTAYIGITGGGQTKISNGGVDANDGTNTMYLTGSRINMGTGTIYSMFPAVSDGASAIAYLLGTTTTLSNATAKLLSVKNNTVERFNILSNGTANYVGNLHSYYGTYSLVDKKYADSIVTSIGTGVANRMAFWTGASSLSYSNSLLFDSTNKNLALGGTTSDPISFNTANNTLLTLSGKTTTTNVSSGVLALNTNKTTIAQYDTAGFIVFSSQNNGTTPNVNTRVLGKITGSTSAVGGVNGYGGNISIFTKASNLPYMIKNVTFLADGGMDMSSNKQGVATITALNTNGGVTYSSTIKATYTNTGGDGGYAINAINTSQGAGGASILAQVGKGKYGIVIDDRNIATGLHSGDMLSISKESITASSNNSAPFIFLNDYPTGAGATSSGSAIAYRYGSSYTIRMDLNPAVANGANIAYYLDTKNALSVTGAKLLSLGNGGVEKFNVNKDGFTTTKGITSNPTAGLRNELIGLNAGNTTMTGTDNIIVGTNTATTLTTASKNILIGDSITYGNPATVDAVMIGHKIRGEYYCVAIGSNVNSGINSVNIGRNSNGGSVMIGGNTTGVSFGVALGNNAYARSGVPNGKGAIALGNHATADSGQFVVGCPTTYSSGTINEVIMGSGNATASPNVVTHRNTNALGTNIAGANLIYQASRGTGTGVGGNIVFKTSPSGASGSTLNTAVDKLIIRGDGNTRIGKPASDYTNIDSLGHLTLVGKALVWNDCAIGTLQFPTGGTAPLFTTGFRGSADIGAWYFQGTINNDQAYFQLQVGHDVKNNDSINIHVHWSPTTIPLTTDTVVWQLNYTMANIGDQFPIAVSTTVKSACGIVQWNHNITTLLLLPTGSGGISRIFNCSIRRLQSDVSDTYTSNAGMLSIDAHAKIDGFGSNLERVK